MKSRLNFVSVNWRKLGKAVAFGVMGIIGILCVVCFFLAQSTVCRSARRPAVADEKAAVRVAEALLVSRYGSEVLEQRPFNASLTDGYWIVRGSSKCEPGARCFGGVARVELNRADGHVRDLAHRR